MTETMISLALIGGVMKKVAVDGDELEITMMMLSIEIMLMIRIVIYNDAEIGDKKNNDHENHINCQKI